MSYDDETAMPNQAEEENVIDQWTDDQLRQYCEENDIWCNDWDKREGLLAAIEEAGYTIVLPPGDVLDDTE